MKLKKVIIAIVLMLSMFICVGCTSGEKEDDADLKITFFNGGYGEDWINNLASRFEAAKGVKVKVISSNEGNCGADNYITSGYNLSDIYFGENIPWKSLSQEGKLADLSDVYNAEVATRNGNVKIKDFLSDVASQYFYSQMKLSDSQYYPWAMPWTVQPNAMAYNADILTIIKHVSEKPVTEGLIGEDGTWDKPPVTVDDLYAFCEDCIAFNNNSAEKQAFEATQIQKRSYAPIGWAGTTNIDSIGFFIITWWAEAQGLYESNYEFEGSFYDFYNFGNTSPNNVNQTVNFSVFNQSGLAKAYDTFVDLLIDNETPAGSPNYNYGYKNTLNNPYSNNAQQLQQLFVASKVGEKPILTIASSYLENEVIKNRYLDSDQDGKQDFSFKFMNVPKFDEDSENLLWGRLSDCAVIPKKAPHVELAKEFLIFMSSEEEIDNFSKDTNGGLRPFKCDVRTSVTGNEYSEFANSLFDVYYNSTLFCEYPMKAESLAAVSHIYRYDGPLYIGNVPWSDIINIMKDPKGKTPGKAIAQEVIFREKQANLESWKKKYKVSEVVG